MIETMNIRPFAGAYQPVWQNGLFCHTNNVISSVIVFNAKVQYHGHYIIKPYIQEQSWSFLLQGSQN